MVLVGAGHAHAIVLERWAESPPTDAELWLVTDRAEVVYSGMIPGRIAGEYGRDETIIDARSLAGRAGARLVEASVVVIDAEARRLELDDGEALRYDVASLDVGSRPAGVDVVAEPGLVIAPRAIDLLEDRLAATAAEEGARRAVVVGGGAAGVELAAALASRLGSEKRDGAATLLEEGARLMPAYHPRVSERVRRALERRGVEVELGSSVAGVRDRASDGDEAGPETDPPSPAVAGSTPEPRRPPTAVLTLDDGARIEADLVIWATGSAPPELPRRSGLPVDEAGFVLVDQTLRVPGHPDLFAVGDCASLPGRDVPKAGVHAVRQGPVLFDNLVRTVERRARTGPMPSGRREADLREYEPQSDFLTLLNLGDGTALGTKWGLGVEGRWVRWIKDVIDRRFVRRFRA